MSNYRKTMTEALREIYLNESVIDKVKEIDRKKSAKKIDGVMVDSFTASAISQVYDKVNDKNKKRMEKLPIKKLADLAMQFIKHGEELVPEEVDLDEWKTLNANRRVSGGDKRRTENKNKKGSEIDEAQDGGDFKPHMMYDPKTGKGYKADTMDDHLRMKKMGYTHDAPKKEEVEVDEQLAKIKGKTPADDGRRAATQDDIDRAEKKGDKKEVAKLKEDGLDEGKLKDLVIKGQDLEAYAKKSGGIDKKDMMNVAAMLKKGDKSGALKYAKKLDTDPRDYILDLMGEEVELDEDIMPLIFGGGIIAALLPVLFMSVREIIRGTPLESSIKKIVDKLKKNKNYKMSDSEKSDVKGFVSKVKKDKPSLLQKAMKKIKEEVELDEGKMQDVWQKRNAKSLSVGPFELLRGKPGGVHTIKRSGKVIGDFSLDTDADKFVANIKGERAQWVGNDIDSLFTHLQKNHKEEAELDEASARADARRSMRRDPEMRQRAFSKDDSATDDDVKGASKNIMMQMRKAQSLNGRFDVEFADGKKVKIPAKMAIAVQQKYNKMRRPAEKEKFQAKIAKSYRDMLSALKEEVEPKKESVLNRIDRKIKEKNDG